MASMTVNSGLALSDWISIESVRLVGNPRLLLAADWSTQDPRIGKPGRGPIGQSPSLPSTVTGHLPHPRETAANG